MPVPAAHQTLQRPSSAWTLGPWARGGIYLLFLFAGFYFVRAHLLITVPYLHLARYLAGTERLPFQRRVLPMLLLRILLRIPISGSILKTHHGIFADPSQIYLFFLDVVSVAIASFFCMRLYHQASPHRKFSLLVFPIFLFALLWSYVVHTEANYYYPYDMLSLAFFTTGLYFIYARRFVPLLLVMLVGTLNRETTLFLVPLFVLDAAAPTVSWRRGFIAWRKVPWLRAAILLLCWVVIKLLLGRFFRANDRSEDFLRLRYNLRYLGPNNWPQMLGGCGFLLPVVWFLRRRIPDARIAAYMFVIPLWVAVMCVYGVLTETRIYGELCPLVTVAATLLIESYAKDTLPATTVAS